jgi:hypothetical protein
VAVFSEDLRAVAGQRSGQQQRDRDGDHRDEDQRLSVRHAPHRAPPISQPVDQPSIVAPRFRTFSIIASNSAKNSAALPNGGDSKPKVVSLCALLDAVTKPRRLICCLTANDA